jgi:hypothetical protein
VLTGTGVGSFSFFPWVNRWQRTASQKALGLRNTRTLEFGEPLGPFLPGLWPSHTSDLSLSLKLGSLVCQSQGVVADTSAEGSPLLLSLHRGTLPSSPPLSTQWS